MKYRAKLQAAFVTLGLAAIALTGWEASVGASRALEQATAERLNAIRQTRVRQIERWFADLGSHTLALATDEATVSALETFEEAWKRLAPVDARGERALRQHYETLGAQSWYPRDPLTLAAQNVFIAANPHPVPHKDQLLSAPGALGAAHARFHPTFHRYQSAFGFYDIFLISVRDGRVLYTVFKEVDLGVRLTEAPYAASPLAQAYQRALALTEPEQFVTVDYAPYLPSALRPAAFLAAPVWRAGQKAGVLAIQVSIDEVNRVMMGDGHWTEEGLGRTGQAYVVGADGLLRSDLRALEENAGAYFNALKRSGQVPLDRIRAAERNGTAVRTLTAAPEAVALIGSPAGLSPGQDARGVRVLRSHARLSLKDLDWALMAEIEEDEALAPERQLRSKVMGIGAVITAIFLAAAALLARSVTRPLSELAATARRLGQRQFGERMPVQRRDELGDLARAFNKMAEDLERTTVSRSELQVLAGRLITAQEDERRHLARELHDDLSQRLAVVAMEAGRLPESEPAQRIKTHMARLARDIHGVSRRLHPAMLDDLGLVAAVEQEGRALFERGGPVVETEAVGAWRPIPPAAELALFRIVQEALRNVEKHAEAGHVAVTLRREGAQGHLTIEDDGRGFDRAHPDWHAGVGLASMQERVRLLGGRIQVDSTPGRGTKIEAVIPLGE